MVTAEPNAKFNGRYSLEQTCELLGISRRSLYRYIERGSIIYGIRVSTGKKFILGNEILRFWKNHM